MKLKQGLNFFLYSLLWLMHVAALASQSSTSVLFSALLIFSYLCGHLYFFVDNAKTAFAFLLIFIFGYGYCIENLFLSLTVFEFLGDYFISPAFSMACLYPLFFSSFSLFSTWLHRRWFYLLLLSGISAPLAYSYGMSMGAIGFPSYEYSYAMLALIWFVNLSFFAECACLHPWYSKAGKDREKRLHFSMESSFPVSVEKLFSWHEEKGAIEKLLPSDGSVRLMQASQSLDVGQRVHLQMGPSFLNISWCALHTAYEKNHFFEDIQEKGPLTFWKHRHIFTSLGKEESQLRDEISLTLPWAFWTHPLLGKLVLYALFKAFSQRHQVLARDL